MTDQILGLLREVRDLSNGFVADECPRRESEPFIDVWGLAIHAIKSREAIMDHHEPSGDIRYVTHATTPTLVQRLTAMRDRLSEPSPEERGLYIEMQEISDELLESRVFA